MSASPPSAPELLTAVVLGEVVVDDLAGRMAVLRHAHPDLAREVEHRFLIEVLSRIESRRDGHAELARNALKIVGWEAPR